MSCRVPALQSGPLSGWQRLQSYEQPRWYRTGSSSGESLQRKEFR